MIEEFIDISQTVFRLDTESLANGLYFLSATSGWRKRLVISR
jgi:hypothetical protein